MMEMDDDLTLTDLMNVEVLQRIQNAFSHLTGMAALTTDVNGVPVTEGSNFTDFCMKYTRQSEVGCKRCEQCDKMGAEQTWENGRPTTYYCHAGLIDYAAPIIANGVRVGCFIGGQVLTEPPDREKMSKIAAEIGVDPDEFFAAAQEVNIISKENIDEAAEFLYTIARILSDIAYGQYQAVEANKEVERAANMKSDFLANMSHEIRTPMNAVIGMAEMALREDLPPVARDYVQQIKASGKALLTIINDILDFSKIESGKMDVIPVEYEPMSIVNDVSNILITQLKDKDVELILDISPDIPDMLYGDNIRIKQVLLNLANNAVKFTSHGQVKIHMSCTPLSEDEVRMHVAVEDTGIGIKKEDLGKLFQSFQQVDSKRNRNIEGTGLGLAISQRLMHLMNGELKVESEYEKGSRFSFSMPQKIVEKTPCIQIDEPQNVIAAGLIKSPYIRNQMIQDCEYLGVQSMIPSCRLVSPMRNFEIIKEFIGETKKRMTSKNIFIFVEYSVLSENVKSFLRENPTITGVLLMEYNDNIKLDIPNLLLMKKPIYTLNEAMIFNNEEIHYSDSDEDVMHIDFTAPEAQVLIVDDNAINLTVAEGLLEPLKMQVDTATSGQEAIGKISVQHYDMIFMDHMMPELDGVETTHIIRRFHDEYNDVPIIALTANAVDGVREMFLREGMNDFVAKPIEVRTLVAKVKQWLPVEKIKKNAGGYQKESAFKQEKTIEVGDLDTKFAVRLLGSENLFWRVLNDYYKVIEKKALRISQLLSEEDWPAYTIEVHALKSASKQIGALSLSDKAAEMEKAGNAKDIEKIREYTPDMLQQYLAYIPVLKPFCAEEEADDTEKEGISGEVLSALLTEMADASDDLDIDAMESVLEKMNHYRYPDEAQKSLLERLKNAVEEIDTDASEEIISEWKTLL